MSRRPVDLWWLNKNGQYEYLGVGDLLDDGSVQGGISERMLGLFTAGIKKNYPIFALRRRTAEERVGMLPGEVLFSFDHVISLFDALNRKVILEEVISMDGTGLDDTATVLYRITKQSGKEKSQ